MKPEIEGAVVGVLRWKYVVWSQRQMRRQLLKWQWSRARMRIACLLRLLLTESGKCQRDIHFLWWCGSGGQVIGAVALILCCSLFDGAWLSLEVNAYDCRASFRFLLQAFWISLGFIPYFLVVFRLYCETNTRCTFALEISSDLLKIRKLQETLNISSHTKGTFTNANCLINRAPIL